MNNRKGDRTEPRGTPLLIDLREKHNRTVRKET
ncbi:hypothetical protein E2C01_056608 [Portunus trituberculatus]|uniref:Uncharacterized protein n=1 Tax=Portunus trituberculatus TaxID=210409 RepID=A0A5B7GXW2_PORTR|nr:hypothetical protein [Portunus trituberculatus]